MTISIITVTYNNQKTVEHTIQSVLNQTYPNIEYIIINGKSTDGTLEKIKKYKNKISKVVSEADQGMYDALNKGIEIATGEVIGFLHADDFYNDKYVIEKIANIFNTQNIDSLYGDLEYVSASNPEKIIRNWKAGQFSIKELKKGWMPPHPTFFVKKEVYTKLGVFNLKFRIAADYDLMLRFLGKHKISTIYLPKVLVKMRWGGTSNRSISNIIQKSKEDYIALKENNIGGFGSLFFKNFRKLEQFF
ncbi:MAG: glycosyltransferase [Bacteroidetes bacterium]|nr:MAG: glycosyltransferase [Bacteroidota bacterium]